MSVTRVRDDARGPSPPVVVRRATRADVDWVTRLWLEGARTHLGLAGYAPELPETRLQREATLWARDYLDSRSGAIFLAFPRHAAPDAEPVGTLSATVSSRSVLHADTRIVTAGDAFVVPSWRKRGVLRALVTEMEAWARDRGVDAAVAEFAADNPTAAAAWRALGYADEAVRVRRPLHGGR